MWKLATYAHDKHSSCDVFVPFKILTNSSMSTSCAVFCTQLLRSIQLGSSTDHWECSGNWDSKADHVCQSPPKLHKATQGIPSNGFVYNVNFVSCVRFHFAFIEVTQKNTDFAFIEVNTQTK